MKIREVVEADLREWLRMRIALWPGSLADHDADVRRFFEQPDDRKRTFVAEDDVGRSIGFLELDQRSYAPGCSSSPVPFIEGWYVDPSARRTGVGRALVRAAEDWARAAGFTEIGSDVEIDNLDSLAAHEALGYEETDRVVSFRRSLDPVYGTGIILSVPEAEPVVGELRQRFTPGGVRGVPAHVTLLFPFVDVHRLDEECVRRLQEAIGSFGAFDFSLTSTARFTDGVLYLTVEPVEPFRALIARICDAFPGRVPYGRFTPDEVIPHLTVVTASGYPDGPTDEDLEVFDRVEEQLAPSLPIACRARAVTVIADSADGYTTTHEFPLG